MKYTRPIVVFVLIVSGFLLYSFSIYLNPFQGKAQLSEAEIQAAAQGKLIWQKYNCQSCHQLYGLGGYLGPDLTNAASEPGKGEPFIKAMIQAGTSQMPSFKISDEEFQQLMEFMKALDKTGHSDPRNFSIHINGTISQP